MNTVITILVTSTATLAAVGFILFVRQQAKKKLQNSAEAVAQSTIESSKKEADKILSHAHRDAQEIASKARIDLDKEIQSRRKAVADMENRIIQKEKHLESKDSKLNEKESVLEQEQNALKALKVKREALIKDLSDELEKVAGLSKEDAKDRLLTTVEQEVRQRAGQMIKEMEDKARKIANRKAKEIVADAIQRTAVSHVADITTSAVELPDDEMKGRIIGKEGRNIRAFESATGVDVIVDDTPGIVVLSAFDPIRREIAKMSLQKLVSDGRIHPTKIEEAIERSREELDDVIRERGEQAADELGLQFHPEIIKLLGKLHYRTSYGQNILRHSVEAAHVAGIMANTLGVNVNLSKRGTVLHDIGKAIDFEQEGTHTDLGKEICEKYGESDEVINCIMAHHEDEDPDTIEAIIVMVADAISSARPGARRETIETYIKRLEKLETLARGFDGVDKAYAIQAGREIRVMVKPDEVDDPGAKKVAHDLAKKIESELDYPGEVKVSVIRETRAVGVAH